MFGNNDNNDDNNNNNNDNNNNNESRQGLRATDIVVRLGEYDFNIRGETLVQEYTVISAAVHQQGIVQN